jgi:hypothetical protein
LNNFCFYEDHLKDLHSSLFSSAFPSISIFQDIPLFYQNYFPAYL